MPVYCSAIESLCVQGPVIIAGKSMGSRVASMISDEFHASHKIVGLLCLGYPSHPPGKLLSLSLEHNISERFRHPR